MGYFDWSRWHRINAAASRRFDRHRAAGLSVRDRWDRYDRLMDYARSFLAGGMGGCNDAR